MVDITGRWEENPRQLYETAYILQRLHNLRVRIHILDENKYNNERNKRHLTTNV